MSLILEALKKSEQQRRLGEAPTLASPVLAVRRRRSLLPVFAALILAALGAGWWLSRAPAPATPDATPTKTTAAPAPAAANHAAPAQAATPPAPRAPVAHDAAPNRREGVAVQSTSSDAIAAANERAHVATTPAPVHGDLRTAVAPAPASTPPPAAVAPGSAPAHNPAVAASAQNPAPNAARTAAPPATPPTSAAVAATKTERIAAGPVGQPTAATSASKPAAPAAPPQPALPSVWELPYATRKDLPEIALTMHVYSSVPGERFVVIKGDRHVEGDDLGNGLKLQEIRSDGMVLEFRGQRFVYPRDGR